MTVAVSLLVSMICATALPFRHGCFFNTTQKRNRVESVSAMKFSQEKFSPTMKRFSSCPSNTIVYHEEILILSVEYNCMEESIEISCPWRLGGTVVFLPHHIFGPAKNLATTPLSPQKGWSLSPIWPATDQLNTRPQQLLPCDPA